MPIRPPTRPATAPGCASGCSTGAAMRCSTHELIEYLLAMAIPRRDTKPLAWALLREFGGIGGVLTADSDALSPRARDG